MNQTEVQHLSKNGAEVPAVPSSTRIAIISANWHNDIVHQARDSATQRLVELGVNAANIQAVELPGAFEIPLIAQKMAESKKFDAVICLGAVIRGATSHYDYVCAEVSKGVALVNLETGVPCAFGVLTTENIEQAVERAGTKAGNKGSDAAATAIEMVNLLKAI